MNWYKEFVWSAVMLLSWLKFMVLVNRYLENGDLRYLWITIFWLVVCIFIAMIPAMKVKR